MAVYLQDSKVVDSPQLDAYLTGIWEDKQGNKRSGTVAPFRYSQITTERQSILQTRGVQDAADYMLERAACLRQFQNLLPSDAVKLKQALQAKLDTCATKNIPGTNEWSFKNHYLTKAEALKRLEEKIAVANLFLKCIPKIKDSSPLWGEMYSHFQLSLAKNTRLKAFCKETPGKFIQIPKQDPFEVTGVRWAQKQGLKGKNGKIGLIDGSSNSASHVSSIIAEIANLAEIVKTVNAPIVNWSGIWPQEATNTKEGRLQMLRDLLKSGTLLVQALGNGETTHGCGVDISKLPDFDYLKEKDIQDQAILVGNIQAVVSNDEVLLHPSSNQPGDYGHMALCAPGTEIPGVVVDENGKKTYQTLTGTWMATAFVSGIAALLQEANLTPAEIRRCLFEGALPIIIDREGKARAINPHHLSKYSKETIEQSRRIFGMGKVHVQGAFRKAKELYPEKAKELVLIAPSKDCAIV